MPSRIVALCVKGCGAPRVHNHGRYCAYHAEKAAEAAREYNRQRLRRRRYRANNQEPPEVFLCKRCNERPRTKPMARYCEPCRAETKEEQRLRNLEYHRLYWQEHGAERKAKSRERDAETRAWRTEKFCADCKINLVGFRKRFCADCLKAHHRAAWERRRVTRNKPSKVCAWDGGCSVEISRHARSTYCPEHRLLMRRRRQAEYAAKNHDKRQAYQQAYQQRRRERRSAA